MELLLPKTKGILVCGCYRPPSDKTFLSKMEQSLSKLGPGVEFYVLGDINIDLSKPSSLRVNYQDFLDASNCDQLITEPTRVTLTTASVLDHIFTNSRDKIKRAGVIEFGFSDHLAIYCSRGILRDNTQSGPRIKKVRCYKKYSPYNFQQELNGVDWSAVMSSPNVEFCLREFSRLFLAAIDRVAPFRDVRMKKKTNPWMNDTILSGIRLRDKLLSQFRKDKNNFIVSRVL